MRKFLRGVFYTLLVLALMALTGLTVYFFSIGVITVDLSKLSREAAMVTEPVERMLAQPVETVLLEVPEETPATVPPRETVPETE